MLRDGVRNMVQRLASQLWSSLECTMHLQCVVAVLQHCTASVCLSGVSQRLCVDAMWFVLIDGN